MFLRLKLLQDPQDVGCSPRIHILEEFRLRVAVVTRGRARVFDSPREATVAVVVVGARQAVPVGFVGRSAKHLQVGRSRHAVASR